MLPNRHVRFKFEISIWWIYAWWNIPQWAFWAKPDVSTTISVQTLKSFRWAVFRRMDIHTYGTLCNNIRQGDVNDVKSLLFTDWCASLWVELNYKYWKCERMNVNLRDFNLLSKYLLPFAPIFIEVESEWRINDFFLLTILQCLQLIIHSEVEIVS